LNVLNSVSDCKSENKTIMAYQAVTATGSPQYKLLNSTDAWTNENGLRMYKNRYCVAVGSGYCSKIGTRINVVLEDGSILRCIMGDAKSDAHTDSSTHTYHVGGYDKGKYYEGDGSVVEFIIDSSTYVRHGGTVNWIEGFEGKVAKVIIIPDDMVLAEDLEM